MTLKRKKQYKKKMAIMVLLVMIVSLGGPIASQAEVDNFPLPETFVNPTSTEVGCCFDINDDPITYDLEYGLTVTDNPETGLTASEYQMSEGVDTILSVGPTYYWHVRACDPIICSDYSSADNFIVQEYVNITLIQSSTDFGTIKHAQVNDTSNDLPSPFVVQNDGTVSADIYVSAVSSIWDSVTLDTQYFQSMAGVSESGSFDWATSQIAWGNIRSTNTLVLDNLKDAPSSTDTGEIEFRIEVPVSESTTSKSTSITVTGVYP